VADNYPHGLFSWADLSSPDPASAKVFYSGLFGWEGEDQHDPDGNYIYTLFTIDGKNVAGLGQQPEMMQGLPPVWNSYINVNSVDEVVAAASAAGRPGWASATTRGSRATRCSTGRPSPSR